jgi:hypothetical protein
MLTAMPGRITAITILTRMRNLSLDENNVLRILSFSADETASILPEVRGRRAGNFTATIKLIEQHLFLVYNNS